MKFNKSSILGVFLFVFVALFVFGLSSFVSASDFTLEHETIEYRIGPGGVAKYNFTITNLLDETSRYSFSLSLGDSLNWVSFPSNVRVDPLSTESFTFNIAPKSGTPVGVYRLNVDVKSEDSRESVPLSVHYSFDGFFSDFVPNVETRLFLPEKLDPRENARVSVTIRNRNPLNIENAELRIRSDLFEGTQTLDIRPGPYPAQDLISKDLIFQMNPLQEPGEYEVFAQIYFPAQDKIISEDKKVVVVEGYSSTPSRLETSTGFLVSENRIFVENFGNRDATAEVKLSASWLKRLFSSTDPKAEFESINGETSFVWRPVLEPTEQKVIVVKTNYWPLAIFILVVILSVLAYFKFRSPIVLEKEIAVVDEDSEEGSSDLKVRLFVKNRTGKSVNSLTISDKVRGITDYIESNQLGHVKPSRATKTSKKGTVLYWDVDVLEPFEERIFTYKLKSKLRVVGDLTLPKAKAKFECNNRERRIFSKKPYFKKVKPKKAVE